MLGRLQFIFEYASQDLGALYLAAYNGYAIGSTKHKSNNLSIKKCMNWLQDIIILAIGKTFPSF